MASRALACSVPTGVFLAHGWPCLPLNRTLLHCQARHLRKVHARAEAGTPGQQQNVRKKPHPPRPTVMPPPQLPTKEDDVWLNGALLVDKPLKWTSSDVVCKLRGALDVKKIGHAGTLDPMATGLLVVCVGKGTKSSQLLTSEDKTYSGVLRLGEATPSYDSETAVSETAAWEHISAEQLQDAATKHYTGHLQQVPPIYSAISVNGTRMYKAARAGEDITRDPRSVHVLEYRVWQDLTGDNPCPQNFKYFIRCGKGTYVRSLIHDLGEKVGSKAHVLELRRESSGGFDVSNAWQLDALLELSKEMGLGRPPRQGKQRRKRKTKEGNPSPESVGQPPQSVPAL